MCFSSCEALHRNRKGSVRKNLEGGGGGTTMMTHGLFFLLIVLGSGYHPKYGLQKPAATVDVIEFNTCRDATGEVRYQQYIFWRWMPDHSRLSCAGWVLADDARHHKQGEYTYVCRGHAVSLITGEVVISGGDWVRARIFRVTDGPVDRERLARQYEKEIDRDIVFPPDQRQVQIRVAAEKMQRIVR